MKSETSRILARDCLIPNNTRVTHINNNDLIIGPSGAGKTRSYVRDHQALPALQGATQSWPLQGGGWATEPSPQSLQRPGEGWGPECNAPAPGT